MQICAGVHKELPLVEIAFQLPVEGLLIAFILINHNLINLMDELNVLGVAVLVIINIVVDFLVLLGDFEGILGDSLERIVVLELIVEIQHPCIERLQLI